MQRPNPMLGVSGSIRMAPFRMGTFELIPMLLVGPSVVSALGVFGPLRRFGTEGTITTSMRCRSQKWRMAGLRPLVLPGSLRRCPRCVWVTSFPASILMVLIPMWVTSFLAFGWSISKHSLQSDGRHAEA